MRAGDRPLAVGLLIATSACCLALALIGAADGVPFLIPAVSLALPLARGLYLGESKLLALSRSRPTRSRAPSRSLPSARVEPRAPRGSRLIAMSLAKRPPPLPAPTS